VCHVTISGVKHPCASSSPSSAIDCPAKPPLPPALRPPPAPHAGPRQLGPPPPARTRFTPTLSIREEGGRSGVHSMLHPYPQGVYGRAGAGAGMTWGGISEVSRFSCMKFLGVPWGLRPRRTEWKLALSLPFMLPSAHCC
jgi:hypothetical protein